MCSGARRLPWGDPRPGRRRKSKPADSGSDFLRPSGLCGILACSGAMLRLIRDLITPYRWTLCIVFVAMVIETAMSLAGPWPLKIVLDNVVGSHHLPGWLHAVVKHVAGGAGKMQIAGMAA